MDLAFGVNVLGFGKNPVSYRMNVTDVSRYLLNCLKISILFYCMYVWEFLQILFLLDFLCDLVRVAKSRLQKGPKKESFFNPNLTFFQILT